MKPESVTRDAEHATCPVTPHGRIKEQAEQYGAFFTRCTSCDTWCRYVTKVMRGSATVLRVPVLFGRMTRCSAAMLVDDALHCLPQRLHSASLLPPARHESRFTCFAILPLSSLPHITHCSSRVALLLPSLSLNESPVTSVISKLWAAKEPVDDSSVRCDNCAAFLLRFILSDIGARLTSEAGTLCTPMMSLPLWQAW